MSCAAEIDETKKKETDRGDWREGRKADIFRQLCSGWQFCPPPPKHAEEENTT